MGDMKIKLKASEVTEDDIIQVVTNKQCHKKCINENVLKLI